MAKFSVEALFEFEDLLLVGGDQVLLLLEQGLLLSKVLFAHLCQLLLELRDLGSELVDDELLVAGQLALQLVNHGLVLVLLRVLLLLGPGQQLLLHLLEVLARLELELVELLLQLLQLQPQTLHALVP